MAELKTRVELENEFADFWAKYPRKLAKGAARRAYVTARKKASFKEIMDGVVQYINEMRYKEKQFIKHPATWLNNECWLDEPELEPDHQTEQQEELLRLVAVK